jgi:dipeptidyl aminopeptidase/acylaminoacyl peptidase
MVDGRARRPYREDSGVLTGSPMPAREVDTSYACDGQTVPARAWRPPPGEGKAPAVLLCPGRLREIEGLTFLAEELAARGMVVLATRYRGMDMRTDDQDCIAGLDHLANLPEVDSARIVMVGHSRGAMASLRVAGQDARVRSVVALQPVTDLGAYVVATRGYAPTRYARLAESLGGSPEEQPDTYDRLSALTFADRIRVPVLLVAGTMDLHSPADHSVWMHKALRAAGNQDVHLEVLEGVGHFFERMYFGYEHDKIIDLTVGWLEETVGLKLRAGGAGGSRP